MRQIGEKRSPLCGRDGSPSRRDIGMQSRISKWGNISCL